MNKKGLQFSPFIKKLTILKDRYWTVTQPAHFSTHRLIIRKGHKETTYWSSDVKTHPKTSSKDRGRSRLKQRKFGDLVSVTWLSCQTWWSTYYSLRYRSKTKIFFEGPLESNHWVQKEDIDTILNRNVDQFYGHLNNMNIRIIILLVVKSWSN